MSATLPETIPTPLRQALEARGYETLTPVQEDVLAAPQTGDLLVSAQTGSGKTVAYGLALATTLLGEATHLPPAPAPLALVIAPTRELAMQVHTELSWLYAAAGARVVSCIGGMDPKREAQALFSGPHIVVGTPGRLCDHLARGRLNLTQLRAAVLDEADEMLDLGFREELETLLDASPAATRRTLLFSATLPRGIVDLARRYQHDAHRIETGTRGTPHADIEHRAMRVARGDEEHAVVNLLRYVEAPVSMVFCGTRDGVRHLHASLQERGFASVALSGELSQTERSRAVQLLRSGRARVCVATDVAARGLDLPNLDLVIHADMPQNPEVMLHRSGRTGRAGRKGMSVLVVPHSKARRATMLLQGAKITAHWTTPPDTDQVHAADEARLADAPIFQGDVTDDERTAAASLIERVGAERVAVALRRLVVAALPEPEELSPRRHLAPAGHGRGRGGCAHPAAATGTTTAPACGSASRWAAATRPTRNGLFPSSAAPAPCGKSTSARSASRTRRRCSRSAPRRRGRSRRRLRQGRGMRCGLLLLLRRRLGLARRRVFAGRPLRAALLRGDGTPDPEAAAY